MAEIQAPAQLRGLKSGAACEDAESYQTFRSDPSYYLATAAEVTRVVREKANGEDSVIELTYPNGHKLKVFKRKTWQSLRRATM